MIEFKKGEFMGGDIMNIIHFNFDDKMDSWWNWPLKEDCFILYVPVDRSKMSLINVNHINIKYIPRIEDVENEFWGIFWDTDLTAVFEFKDYALNFMKNYVGVAVTEVRSFEKQIRLLSEYEIEEQQFHHISEIEEIQDITKYPDEELYNLILDNLSPHFNYKSFFATFNQVSIDLSSILR